jgi:hypothetical protein
VTDLSIRLQGSDTLMNWITYNTVVEADREAFTGYDQVTLLDPITFNAGRRFLRLRVELLPLVEPRAPTQLALQVITPTQWELTWTDPNTMETGYAIERLLPTHVWERLATVGADIGVWQHATADYEASMTYRAVAIGADETEAASEPITLPDTDGDGLPDALELGASYAGVGGTYASYSNQFSSTGSGVSDGWLAANGFNPATHDVTGDADNDGLSDEEEAKRGTDPNSEDSDGDDVLDAADGWPRHAWITTPPLPEIRYAVVPLRSFGLDAAAHAFQLDDASNVLAAMDDEYVFWKASDGTMETVPLLAVPNSSYGETSIPGLIQLGRNGHVTGWIVADAPSLTGAAIWQSGETTATPLTPVAAPGNPDWFPFAVNGAGHVVGVQYSNVWSEPLNPDMPIEATRWGGVDYSSTTWLGGSFIEDWQSGMAYIPTAINDAAIMGVYKTVVAEDSNRVGIMAGNNFVDLGPMWGDDGSWNLIRTITSGVPVVALGTADTYPSYKAWWAHEAGGAWTREALQVWNPATQTLAEITNADVEINDRLEIIANPINPQNEATLTRNGITRPLTGLLPSGWSSPRPLDINHHGVILAEAVNTAAGDSQAEPVLLLPVELVSEDRLIKGSVRIPDGMTDVTLGFRHLATDTELGTFAGLEPGAVDSPSYVYASADDILSEDEQASLAAGTLDPRANTQPVLFYRDAEDPRRLHFATAFDRTGDIEITLAFGPAGQRVTATLAHALTAQAETAGLLAAFDQRIESMDIPEVTDFDLDSDGDGIPDGGPGDLVTAAQPGTMAVPGAFVSERAEEDPLNLVLLVNSDDDNADSQPDQLHPDLDAADDDLSHIVLRAPGGVTTGTLTLTHTGGSALRLRFATGPPVASGTSIDLAAPAGPLAALASGPLTVYAEGLAPAEEVIIRLDYTPAGESVPAMSDAVHLTVLDPAALASLQTRHRYFHPPGDLGGLLSRRYAANGAYHQHRVGLAPIGDDLPLQNRGRLAKALYSVIGSLKVTAAYYRGTVDGFWLGLKSDWQGLQDTGTAAGSAIAFFFVEDDAGRMSRAVAIYDQVKEVQKAFDGIKLRELPGIMGQMASAITRDLYTDAEAALGWEPLATGLDPQVINYMAGVTTGFVGEQIMLALIPGGAAAKIAPVLRNVVLAVKAGTRYSLEALGTLAKTTAKLARGVQRVARSQDEAKAALHATQKVKQIEFPGGLKAPQVIDNWFKLKPQLYDEVLNIWADSLPATLTNQRLTHMMNDLASVMHRFGNATDLPDDAVKGFAHLQARLFKVGEDNLSRWKDMEKLFGGLDTPAKKTALKESLVAYKQAVEIDTNSKFFIKNITAIKSNGYRYSSFEPPSGWSNFTGILPARPEGRYVSFDFFDNKFIATDRLYLPLETSAPKYRFEFETSEVASTSRMARGVGDSAPNFFEPATRDIPNTFPGAGTSFKGNASQFIVDGDLPLSRVIDMDTNLQVWPR